MLTRFGAGALVFPMITNGLERRRAGCVLAVACGRAGASAYGFLSGGWPFGLVEAIRAPGGVHRFGRRRAGADR